MNQVTVKSFVKSFVALVQGDSAEAQAQKTFRQVQSALNTQIAVMTGDLVSKEEAVSDAQEAFDKARINNGKDLSSSDRYAYVRRLIEAKNKVQEAQDALDEHKSTLSFLKEQLASLEAEVAES